MKTGIFYSALRVLGLTFGTCAALVLSASVAQAKGGGGKPPKNPSCTITAPADPIEIDAGVTVDFSATAENGTTPYAVTWDLPGSDLTQVQDTIDTSGGSSSTSPTYLADGTYTATFNATDDRGNSCSDSRTVAVGSEPPPPVAGGMSVLAVNDLGMHCADLDYQIFTILPPFNVVHAQVIQQGTGDTPDTLPQILTNTDVDVVYSAVSSDLDPKGPGSINTTSDPNIFNKTNFWDPIGSSQIAGHPNSLGGLVYAPLYPSVLAGALLEGAPDLSGFCNTVEFPDGCPSILNVFEPLALETGLPVPDLHKLFPEAGDPILAVAQQHMPGPSNTPQYFDRFDADLPFFVDFPFGYRVLGANWFAADGIPILPIDDNGNENAYPLMRVQAVTKDSDPSDPANVQASVDVVLPVASEADCQLCHAVSDDPAMTALGFTGNGAASDMSDTGFDTILAAAAPGTGTLNQLQNAAKINILRLHDVKHGATYESWPSPGPGPLVATACNAADNPNNAVEWNDNCLINQTPVQCSQCHYSPALDLAQAGPVDEPEQGPRGRQQQHHISQSRAMHGHHGALMFMDKPMFPTMPPPDDALRTANQGVMPINDYEQGILEETCYACHPGKNTQCLRGAMLQGGMLCQDCHGDMAQVGDDFTENFPNIPFPDQGSADLSKRVPWASEPGCQSCHTGDAVNTNHPSDAIVASDGIRLMQAYVDADATPIASPDSRFAENQGLYRLSQGHGGVKCENCHGSTHAIWPVTPREGPFVANDNLAAIQLQGHDGKIQECDVCHERDAEGNLTMPLGLNGPHGMHPVSDNRWNHQHRNFTGGGKFANCKGCHMDPTTGELTGSVLSATSADRVLDCKNSQGDFLDCAAGNPTAFVPAGTEIGCGNCHKQK